jgi:hypothetical protein
VKIFCDDVSRIDFFVLITRLIVISVNVIVVSSYLSSLLSSFPSSSSASSALQLSQFQLSRNLLVPTPVIPVFIIFNSCVCGSPCRGLLAVMPAGGSFQLCLLAAPARCSCHLCLPAAPTGGSCELCLPGAFASFACRQPLSGTLLYQINIKYYMKTRITETGITGVGTRDAGTSEISN